MSERHLHLVADAPESEYQLMDWRAVRDAYPKMAQASSRGRQYVIWEHDDGYQVSQRTVGGGLRSIRWHRTRTRLPDIGTAITLAEQWNFIEAGGTIHPTEEL